MVMETTDVATESEGRQSRRWDLTRNRPARKRTVRIRCSVERGEFHTRIKAADELVVLLHGFAARPLLMGAIQRNLRKNDFDVVNWGYRSTRRSIAFHSEHLRCWMQRLQLCDLYRCVHFVGYSMGGIVARHAVAFDRELPPGRIVLMGTPNRGTHVARTAARVIGRLCPALQDLSDSEVSTANSIPLTVGREIGVIAADKDWVVPIRSTHLHEQSDHIVLRGDHLRLPLLPEASRQVIEFLKYGEFVKPSTRAR